MSFSTVVIGVFVVLTGACFMLFPGQTPQSHTQAAFDQWARGCKPDDFHYGVTEDERGTRAFIVTCAPVGRPV